MATHQDHRHQPSTWWLRIACFSFFAGLSCYVPLLTGHLQWLGFDLQEIGIIHVIASTCSAFGLVLAGTWTPRCGHRSNLAVAVLLAAFCGAGLVLVPRLDGRAYGRAAPETDRPVAEILCRPEGSALFFRKCGDSCELDAVTRTELTVSDCRFEAQSKLPVNFLDWINRFALSGGKSGSASGDIDDDDDLSQPERGDLPQKVSTPSPNDVKEESDPFHLVDVEPEENLLPDQSGASSSGVAPYEYDYDENHRQSSGDFIGQEIERRRRRKRRQSVPLLVDLPVVQPQQFDDEFEIAEKADLPYTSSPHICFSSYSSSTTTCHVFTGTNHLFRFNTSFYSGTTHNGQCFYSLNYDDVDNQILSELRCRSNKPNHQVRCRAEGMKLRASVTRNGTSTCHSQPLEGNNFHLVFWLYLIFRTCGEIAVIGGVLLLHIVTLNEDHERAETEEREGGGGVGVGVGSGSSSGTNSWMMIQKKGSSSIIYWWPWSLAGLVVVAPLAGWIADVAGFGIAFLLGSVWLGLAALCMALSPVSTPPGPHPILAATLAVEEDEQLERQRRQDDGRMGSSPSSASGQPVYRISGRDLRAILSDGTALLILLFTLLVGMASSVVPTAYYWYLLELGASRLMLGASVTAQWIVAAPVLFFLSRWLWRRCGHRYIFIIGLLLYSIRFLGYTMLDRILWLVAIETIEPLCSLWMLLTASARIEQLENRRRVVGVVGLLVGRGDRWRSWKINTWALIIIFHYSFGRALGGVASSLAAHHFGLMRVFVGAALISLFVAACWFLWIHLKSPCKSTSRRRKNRPSAAASSSTDPANSQFPKGQKPNRRNNENKEQELQRLKASPV